MLSYVIAQSEHIGAKSQRILLYFRGSTEAAVQELFSPIRNTVKKEKVSGDRRTAVTEPPAAYSCFVPLKY